MAEYIEREAVTAMLKRECSPRVMAYLVDELCKIHAADVRPVEWIPVTERLPEAGRKSYWVCTDTGYQCECRWTNNRFGIGELDEWGWSIFDIPQYQKVVAWMPLPKPYEPPKEE